MKAYGFNRVWFRNWWQIGYRVGSERFYAYVTGWFSWTLPHITTFFPRSTLWHLQLSRGNIKCTQKLSKCCQCRSVFKLIHMGLNDCRNFQCGCPILHILPGMPDQKWWTLHWSSYSWWGRERVSVLFDYKGSQYNKQRQWCTKVNIIQITVAYLNVTINRKTQKPEPEIGADRSSWTQPNLWVDGYRYRFGLPRCPWSGFWKGLDHNPTIFPVRTQIAARLPRPVANSI